MAQASMENGGPATPPPGGGPESLYERFPWLYAFCRDRLFRDDTELMAATLWPAGIPVEGGSLLDLGCGPGFYARRLAGRFERLRVTGIDRSERQLRRARSFVSTHRLANCTFEEGDVLALDRPAGSIDAVVASRLLMILPEPERALAEMHRVLRPGGRCFIAEPRSAVRAAVPLRAARLLASLHNIHSTSPGRREADGLAVLAAGEFEALTQTQPWATSRLWRDTWYQYAVCEKGPG